MNILYAKQVTITVVNNYCFSAIVASNQNESNWFFILFIYHRTFFVSVYCLFSMLNTGQQLLSSTTSVLEFYIAWGLLESS